MCVSLFSVCASTNAPSSISRSVVDRVRHQKVPPRFILQTTKNGIDGLMKASGHPGLARQRTSSGSMEKVSAERAKVGVVSELLFRL